LLRIFLNLSHFKNFFGAENWYQFHACFQKIFSHEIKMLKLYKKYDNYNQVKMILSIRGSERARYR